MRLRRHGVTARWRRRLDESGSLDEAGMVRLVAEVADRVERLSGRRPSYVPTTENHDAGYTFLRREGDTWCLLARERGRECFRRETASARELLGWVASDLCRDVAQREELESRVAGPDTRRRWFARWAELTRALDPRWGDEVDAEIAAVLERAPFRDDPDRVELGEVQRELDACVEALARRLGRTPRRVPTSAGSTHDAVHFTVRDGVHCLDLWLYGKVARTREAGSRHELLGWLVADVAHSLAVDEVRDHPVGGVDPATAARSLQRELVRELDPAWAESDEDR